MVVDAIHFYSEAVKIHTQGKGIHFAINLRAEQANGRAPHEWYQLGGFGRDPIIGLFKDQEEIRMVSSLLLNEQVDKFGQKYF